MEMRIRMMMKNDLRGFRREMGMIGGEKKRKRR